MGSQAGRSIRVEGRVTIERKTLRRNQVRKLVMTQPSAAAISTRLELRLVSIEGAFLPVEAAFRYEPSDPFAVRAEFQLVPGDEPVVWVFARELVLDGLQGPAGRGDVALWPSRSQGQPVVCIALSSPDGQALMECRRGDLVRFLEQTLARVPAGEESHHVNLDVHLERLLADS